MKTTLGSGSRTFFCAALVGVLLVGSAGCATVKKKFTRKPKDASPARPVVYTEKDYVKPYTNEYYYTSNFNMWKVWHEELVKGIGGNNKHLSRSAEEVVARLKEMQGYLEEPKKAELGDQIVQVERAAEEIARGVSDARGGQAKFTLEKTLRIIKANFYADDVRPWIKKDEIVL